MQSAEKISITMPPEMMRIIRQAVEAGEFGSPSEALRDAVRVWQRQRLEKAERLATIRTRVNRSLDDPRRPLTLEETEAEMNGFMDERARAFRDASH